MYKSVEEVPSDYYWRALRESVRAGHIDPTMDFCRRLSFFHASRLWWSSKEYYHLYVKADKYKIRTWEEWDLGYGDEYIKKKKAFEDKKERIKQARAKGGIGKQSPKLKAILSKPISFKHTSGVSITVLPQSSVKDVASELSKIAFCEYTNLAKILVRGSGHTNGWGSYKIELTHSYEY